MGPSQVLRHTGSWIGGESGAGDRIVRALVGALAAALVLSSWVLPLWQARLEAPQYPDGLHMMAYGDRIEGDLAEIDSLNHYIGMSSIRIEDLPELALWPLAVGLALAAVAVSVIGGRRLPARAARLYLWLLPLGVLATVQFRLYQFGHDLDPGAALRVGEFTPWVVGPTTVWNFTAWSRPGSGTLALLLAAAVVSFGPGLVKRFRGGGTAVLATAVFLGLALLATPAQAHQGHHGETAGEHSLAALVAEVPDGGTLILPPGTYRGDLVIDRTIRLEGRGMPLILGDGTGTVLTIGAPGTEVVGIRVAGSGAGPTGSPAGIRIEADDVTVEGVTIEDSYTGIAVVEAGRVRLVDNTIIGRSHVPISSEGHALGEDHHSSGTRGDGISLWHADDVLVRGTRIEGARDGIYLSFGSGALIDGNRVTGSRYGVHSMYAAELVIVENVMEHNLSGLVLMYGGPVLVLRNELVDNSSPSTGFGLLLKDVVGVEAVQNVMAANRVGLHVDGPAGGSEPGLFSANTVARNQVGVALYPSAHATFQANSLADNLTQVLHHGRGQPEGAKWSLRGVGNYWSNYRGFDPTNSGRGYLPHVEGSAVDRLLVRSPVLIPLASGPALQLVKAVEDRWMERRPVLVDELPLTRPLSPPLTEPSPDREAGMALAGAGLSLAGLASVALGRAARPGRRPDAV